MKQGLVVFFLLISNPLYANIEDKSPFEKGPMELFSDGLEREEGLLLARSQLRCASLYRLLAELFKRDFPKGDFSNFDTASSELLALGAQINRNISKERGVPEEKMDEIDDRTLGELQQYLNIYTEWLTDNFATQGEYFGSSSTAKNEVEECKLVVELVRSFRSEAEE